MLVVLAFVSNRVGWGRHYGNKEPDVEPPAPSSDWLRLGEPKPGDWLYSFPELGQTFAEYKREAKNLKTKSRRKFYVVPLGRIATQHPDLLKRSAQYFSIFFDCETVQLPAQPLPRAAYNARRNQYDAGLLLDRLMVPLVPKHNDALAIMGLTSEDLYHGSLNFVFGVGSHGERVGLYSVHRFHRWVPAGKEREQVALIRTLKTGSHEIGHILGMAHCTFYECVANGSNSLDESDRRPLFLCPVCLRKMEWNLKFDRLTRYRKLRSFFNECELEQEAAFCERRIKELEKAAEAEAEKAQKER